MVERYYKVYFKEKDDNLKELIPTNYWRNSIIRHKQKNIKYLMTPEENHKD